MGAIDPGNEIIVKEYIDQQSTFPGTLASSYLVRSAL